MPRFVILRHDTPSGHPRGAHFDLMLEHGGALWTWSLSEPPALGMTSQAQALADHRLDYLDYEGPLTGDRGSVQRVEEGEYELLERSQTRVLARLTGKSLRGVLEISRPNESCVMWQVALREEDSAPDHD